MSENAKKPRADRVPSERLTAMLAALKSDRAIVGKLREEIVGALLTLRALQAKAPTRGPGRPQSLNWESAWIVHELVEHHRFNKVEAAARYVLGGDEVAQKDVDSLCRLYRARKRAGGFWHNPWAAPPKPSGDNSA